MLSILKTLKFLKSLFSNTQLWKEGLIIEKIENHMSFRIENYTSNFSIKFMKFLCNKMPQTELLLYLISFKCQFQQINVN